MNKGRREQKRLLKAEKLDLFFANVGDPTVLADRRALLF